MIVLRDYQHDTLEAINAQWSSGYHSTIANLFTGAGKTVIFVEYCKKQIDYTRQRVLVMTPAHVIVKTKVVFTQIYPEFENPVKVDGYRMMPCIGVELANYTEPKARLLIGSVPTLIDRVPTDLTPITAQDIELNEFGGVVKSKTSIRRNLISNRMDEVLSYGMIDEVIIDECHHSLSDSEFLLISRLWQICDALGRPKAKITGFTATAFREDGRALANVFQTMCISRSARWATEHGYLAPLATPIRVEARLPFGKTEVLEVTNWADTILKAWQDKGENRQTLAYLQGVEESKLVAKLFREAGIPTAHIDGEITIDSDGSEYDTEYREEIYRKFLIGEIRVICNYSVILEATDLPPASCMIWARNTDNVVLMTQALGRIRRLFSGNDFLPEKTDALVIDITGRDLTEMTIGTLSGFKVDPQTREYIHDDEELVVETIQDGRDLRDTQKGLVESNGIIYSIGKILRKSGSDWYRSERSGVMSLSISKNEALLIVPPFYTLSNHLSRIFDKLSNQANGGDSSQQLQHDLKTVQKAITLYSNHTLWHVKEGIPKSYQDYVYADSSLDRLMDFAVPYMHDVSDPVEAFFSKKKRWKDGEMTDKQRLLLTDLCGRYKIPYDNSLTSGEASQLICYLKSFNGALLNRLAQVYRELGDYTK